MNEIRISGEGESELKKAILFVLSQTSVADGKQRNIDELKVENGYICASSNWEGFFDRYPQYAEDKIALPLTHEAFADSALQWHRKAQPQDEEDVGFDGTIKKGWIVMSGRDWGDFYPSTDFGYTGYHSDNTNYKVELKHKDIYIFVNWQMYGK